MVACTLEVAALRGYWIVKPSASSLSLDAYYREEYRPNQLVGRGDKTLVQYAIAVRHWIRFAGHLPIGKIDRRKMADFAAWLLKKKLSPATVNKTIRHVMPILRFADDEGDIAKAPKVCRLKERLSVPLALTLDEFAKVLQAAALEPLSRGGIPGPLWWRALLLVCWETGLRMTALLSIRSRDVLFDSGGLYCQAFEQKDREAQWFPLSETTLAAVKSIYNKGNKLLFPKREKNAQIARNFRRILDRSGIYAPTGTGMCFHRIRKSTASYTKQAGGDPQRKLGHSAQSVTQRYFDPRIVCTPAQRNLMPLPSVAI